MQGLIQACHVQVADFSEAFTRKLGPAKVTCHSLLTALITEYTNVIKSNAVSVDTLQTRTRDLVNAIRSLLVARGEAHDLRGVCALLEVLLPLLDSKVPGGPREPLLDIIDHVLAHTVAYDAHDHADATLLKKTIKEKLYTRLRDIDPLVSDVMRVQQTLINTVLFLCPAGTPGRDISALAGSFRWFMATIGTNAKLPPPPGPARVAYRTLPLRMWASLIKEQKHGVAVRTFEPQLMNIVFGALFEDQRTCWPLAATLLAALQQHASNVPLVQLLLPPPQAYAADAAAAAAAGEAPTAETSAHRYFRELLQSDRGWLALLRHMLERMGLPDAKLLSDGNSPLLKLVRSCLRAAATVLGQRQDECVLPEDKRCACSRPLPPAVPLY